MDTYSQQPTYQFSFGGPMTRVVKWLIIVNVAVMLFLFIVDAFLPGTRAWVLNLFALHSRDALLGGHIWQFATYAFLHARSPMHILMNMLMLWMFGRDVERYLGAKKFFWVYIGCDVAGGIG
ncbi:MAG: rhomboid family intramembrane serine protease, partial [Dehalococcoidia bacterium]